MIGALLYLLLAAPPPPEGSASDDRLRRVQERRASLERDLASLRTQEKSLLGEVEALDLEVRLRGEQLREIQLVLQKTSAELELTQRKLGEIEKSIEEARPLLAARARALYKMGDLSYVRMLLSVDRPADMFRGYRFVTALARRDNDRIAAFRASQVSAATTRRDLEARTQKALGLRADLDSARRALEADRKRKTQLLRAIVEKKETHAAYLEELQQAEASLRELLEGLVQGDVAVPIAAFRGSLPWPLAGKVRVAFGRRKNPKFETYTFQNGIEIEARADTPVAVVHEGTVVFADRFRGYGLMVVVDHGGKHHSLYAHLAEAQVQVGQKLNTGDIVGTAGSSGLEGPGLYFEMRFQGKPEDPAGWLESPRHNGG